MRDLDARTIRETTRGIMLMERAGRVIAQVIRERMVPGSRVLVIAGGGNNGGDGLIAARWLHVWGYEVRVACLRLEQTYAGDARLALMQLQQVRSSPSIAYGVSSEEIATMLRHTDTVIDAIFGTGLTTPVRGSDAQVIAQINQHPRSYYVVSADLPSGVCADTGQVLGVAVRADLTLMLGACKAGLTQSPGIMLIGEMRMASIGMNPTNDDVVARAWLPNEIASVDTKRAPDAHKGDHGRLAVFAGSAKYPGAACLCLRGALRGGAGLVRFAHEGHAHMPEEVIPMPLGDDEEVELWIARASEGATALLVGPGWSIDDTRWSLLCSLSKSTLPMLIDADALNIIAERGLPTRFGPTVLTPHPREAARLLGCDLKEVQHDRITAARELAVRYDAVVVLKGAGTVIAGGGEIPDIAAVCEPALASAGTGDVLSGMIAAKLAMGMQPRRAALVGVLRHLEAAEHASKNKSPHAVIASDLVS